MDHKFELTHLKAGSAVDPVCGMKVEIATAKHRADYQQQTYYFCGASCKTKFTTNPAKYLSASSKAVEPVVTSAIYTCPMHPQIQIGRASCRERV